MAKRAVAIPESDEEEEEQEEVFEVSKILDHKHAPKAGLQYLIRWKGYEDPSEDTWEPESNVNETASAKVKAYWRTVSADRRGDQKLSKLAPSPSAALAKKRRSSEQSARGKGKAQAHISDSESEDDQNRRPPPKKTRATTPTADGSRAPSSASSRKKPVVPVEPEAEGEQGKKPKEDFKDKKDDKRRNGPKSPEKADDKKTSVADEQDAGSNGDDTLDGYEAEGEETDYYLTKYADLATFDVSAYLPSAAPCLIRACESDLLIVHLWQDFVDHIETIVAGDKKDGHRMMAVWKIDGTHSYLPEAIWRRKCPQAALDFFVKHLKFKPTNSENDGGDDA